MSLVSIPKTKGEVLHFFGVIVLRTYFDFGSWR